MIPSKAFNDRQVLNQRLETDLARLVKSCDVLQQSIENARIIRSSSDRGLTLQTYHQLLAQNQELDKKLEVVLHRIEHTFWGYCNYPRRP